MAQIVQKERDTPQLIGITSELPGQHRQEFVDDRPGND